MKTVIPERRFRNRLVKTLSPLRGNFNSVIGKGRSGAVSAVYASHFLRVPFFYYRKDIEIPKKLLPILIVDTAKYRGETLRKLDRRIPHPHGIVYFYNEPPIVKFWYEVFK